MSSLPDSLVFEILIQVPVKSLVRLKCVNRFWRCLISHPDFIYTHLKTAKTSKHSCLIISCVLHDNDMRNNSSSVQFYTIKDHEPAVLEYSAQVRYDSYHILPSCNGLVCFYSAHAEIYLCNPSIRKLVRIPDSDIATGSRFLSCGFGFDHRTRTYKIIKISEPFKSGNNSTNTSADDDGLLIEVFMIVTGSWRVVKVNSRFRFPNRQQPVFAKGFFYWISDDHDSASGFLIQSFEIGSESFGTIHPPESVSGKDWRLIYLDELGGELCLVDMDFEEPEGKKRMDLWLFKGVSDSDDNWVQETIVHPSEPLHATRPVAFHGSEILFHGFIKGLDHITNWYDLRTRSFRGANTSEIPSPYFHVRSYVETLVSLQL